MLVIHGFLVRDVQFTKGGVGIGFLSEALLLIKPHRAGHALIPIRADQHLALCFVNCHSKTQTNWMGLKGKKSSSDRLQGILGRRKTPFFACCPTAISLYLNHALKKAKHLSFHTVMSGGSQYSSFLYVVKYERQT